MNFRGLFFDLYGTLFVYGDMSAAWIDWLSAFHDSLKSFGFSISKHELSKHCNGFFGKPKPSGFYNNLTIFEHRIKNVCDTFAIQLANEELAKTAQACISAWQKYVALDPQQHCLC